MTNQKNYNLYFTTGISVLAIIILCFFLYLTNVKSFSFFWLTIVFSSFFISFYAALNWYFDFVKKQQIRSIYKQFPELDIQSMSDLNVKSVTKKIIALSENKTLEIDLLKKQENFRREFLDNVSHELKTPLFSIQGFLLSLIEGGKNDEKILDKYLDRINKSSERLLYIVTGLDTISKMYSEEVLELKPFNIIALVREVFDLLEESANSENIKLSLESKDDLPLMVMGDIQKIEQVMTNLVINAIKHSGNGSKIKVSFSDTGFKTKIAVEDNGIGIEEKDLKRVFERFYRVEKSRNRKSGGSGLGLSITKHILEAHGSQINVTSKPTEGSVFSFSLLNA